MFSTNLIINVDLKSKKMTKENLVGMISSKTGVDKVSALVIIESFMDEVKKSVSSGDAVTLRGFGSFYSKHRAEKVARNINKNTTIIVPAHDIPAFKPSKDFALSISRKE